MFLRKNMMGFSMIELMVVIGILIVVLSLAIPNIIEWGPNLRLKAAAREVLSNARKTRFEAVKRNTNQVVISFAPGGYVPAGQIGSYQVFVDDGAGGGTAGDFIRSGTESILIQQTMPRSVSLYQTSFAAPANMTNFNSRGVPGQVGDIDMRNSKSKYFRVSVLPAGKIRLLTSNDGVNWN